MEYFLLRKVLSLVDNLGLHTDKVNISLSQVQRIYSTRRNLEYSEKSELAIKHIVTCLNLTPNHEKRMRSNRVVASSLHKSSRVYLSTTIIEASRVIEKRGNNLHPPTTPPTNTTAEDEEENRLFIHLQYHPDDISRQRVRTIYDTTCGDLFSRELGIGRPTIAYSRPPNIGDKITQAKLHQLLANQHHIIWGSIFKDCLLELEYSPIFHFFRCLRYAATDQAKNDLVTFRVTP